MAGIDVDLVLPRGYVPMPLHGLDRAAAAATALAASLQPADATALRAEIDQRADLLAALAASGVRYCGMGMHMADGEPIVTWLTVWVLETGTPAENPRAMLLALAEGDPEAASGADVELVTIDGKPMMFRERITDLPVPEVPGHHDADETAPVYQLRATVPSDDGAALAAVELSTAFVSHGPDFRRLVVDIARSVTFTSTGDSTAALNIPTRLKL
ncbi:hypothetical protein [Nocardia sp. BMG51109]|uniref:hypothetical protein n=1 Tax=Nocardia sp. BMG51109 TaxID=1056816 RepID=UPI000465F704|nr:hypothetical protein [Nocardia sp. BMG51109]